MRFARLPVLALATALSLLPVTASAHPRLVGATPPSGSSAPAAPARIVISFSEVLDPARTAVDLVGADGRAVPWESTVSGGTLAVEPPSLPAGGWRVRWTVTGADGDRETGEYRFTIAAPSRGAAGGPGAVERGARILLLLLGGLLAGLLLGGTVLPDDPELRPAAGRRLAVLRSRVWGLGLLSTLGYVAGLVAAGGGVLLLASPAGPPLLVAAGVTAALAAAVFDGGALRAGELASLPTRVLGAVLGMLLIAALVSLVEVPGGDAAAAIAGTLALSAVAAVAGAVIATLATAAGPAGRRAGLARLLPRTVVGLALLGAAAALHPDPLTGAASVTGAVVSTAVLAAGGLVRGGSRPQAGTPRTDARSITLAGTVAPHLPRIPRPAPAPAQATPAPTGPAPEPLPAGTPLHERLSGHFVDLERLLETLEWSAFTGYVRVEGEPPGVLVLVAGELCAVRVEGEPAGAEAAVRVLAASASHGEAMLDVVGLDPETARAVVDLLAAPPLFRDLGARMVNLDGVLDELRERRRDATVLVRSPIDTGVILVRGGGVHGAYTRDHPELERTPRMVAALAGTDGAIVEVRVAAPRPAAEVVTADAQHRSEPIWDRYSEGWQASGYD